MSFFSRHSYVISPTPLVVITTFWPDGTRTGSGSDALSTFIIMGDMLLQADRTAAVMPTVASSARDFIVGSWSGWVPPVTQPRERWMQVPEIASRARLQS